jgi:ribonuclease HI
MYLVEGQMNHYQAFIDGGSRGNPGISASAFVLCQNRRHITTKAESIGIATNNVAEYMALTALVIHLQDLKLPAMTVDVYCDSLLVVNQVNKVWRTKDKTLADMQFITVNGAKDCGISLRLKHVRREKNTEADKAVNRVLDQVEALSKAGRPVEKVVMAWDAPLMCTAAEWESIFFTNL